MTTMASIAAPKRTETYTVEFLFNDGGNYVKREELSPTKNIPHEWLRAFSLGDLMGLGGCTPEEAEEIFDAMLVEIDETEALVVQKEFPGGATFTLSLEIPDYIPTKGKK